MTELGDWEPKPVMSQDMAGRLQAKIERLRDIDHARFPMEPTYRCICRERGWVEVSSEGRTTWRRCTQCDGPPRPEHQMPARRGRFGDDLGAG